MKYTFEDDAEAVKCIEAEGVSARRGGGRYFLPDKKYSDKAWAAMDYLEEECDYSFVSVKPL